jgi:hypothetical protein
MSKLLFILIVALQLTSCSSLKVQRSRNKDFAGVYVLGGGKFQALSDKNYSHLELNADGTFMLSKAEIEFSPAIEQCDYASKGKWSEIADNVIEITSEDYYGKQEGFKYEIKKENKFSQDSLYIQVVFLNDFHPVRLGFTFNHNNSKSITTDETYIVLPKSKHLWNNRTAINQISFSLNADVLGTEMYKSRILFKIFEESIDTEKFNFLTISLPNFDRCFFEFEPYNQELMYIKNKNQLLWQGEIWEKKFKE